MKSIDRGIAGLVVIFAIAISACTGVDEDGRKVDASGKEETSLESVPEEVLAAALAARPDLVVTQVEHETRDGNDYYDIGGTLTDGSELELDMTRIDGVWTVVEFQRDIGLDTVPKPVASTLAEGLPGWTPARIIESTQRDGSVIYEFFGPGAGAERTKHEVRWADDKAELLVDEWAH